MCWRKNLPGEGVAESSAATVCGEDEFAAAHAASAAFGFGTEK
jgi:hypothetical protein